MNRQPAGAPTGGQFAATARTEPALDLDLPAVAMDATAARDMHEVKLDRAMHLLDRQRDTPGATAHDGGYATAEADIALRVAMPQITADANTADLALELVRLRRAQPAFTAPTAPLSDEQVTGLARYALDRSAAAHQDAETMFAEYHARALANPSGPDAADDIPAAFHHAKGTCESYAQSYAELILGDVQHPQAPAAGVRLVSALTRGVRDVEWLQEYAWNPMYPPIPGVGD